MKKRWIWWLTGTVLFIGVVGYSGWNYAIDYTLKSMMSQSLDEELDIDKILAGDFGDLDLQSSSADDRKGKLSEKQGTKAPENGENSNGNHDQIHPPAPPAIPTSGDTAGNDTAKAVQSVTNNGQTPNSSESPQEAVSSAGKDVDHYDPNISLEKAQKVQESITLKEKTKVTTVLVKRLAPSDLSTLIKLAGNGMTVSEKKEAKKLLLDKLPEKEYNELVDIAKKYGLSQGKN